jgi:hypothetical protein
MPEKANIAQTAEIEIIVFTGLVIFIIHSKGFIKLVYESKYKQLNAKKRKANVKIK